MGHPAGGAAISARPDVPRERIAAARRRRAPPRSSQPRPLRRLLPSAAVLVFEELYLDRPERTGSRPGRPGLALPDNLPIYVTSGSTGRPKGVAVPHRGVVNRFLRTQEAFALTADDVVLQRAPAGFDVSVWEIFVPLAVGARVALAIPDGHRDPAYLARAVAAHRVTFLNFVLPARASSRGRGRRAVRLRCAGSSSAASPGACAFATHFFSLFSVPLENQSVPRASIDSSAHLPAREPPGAPAPTAARCRLAAHVLSPACAGSGRHTRRDLAGRASWSRGYRDSGLTPSALCPTFAPPERPDSSTATGDWARRGPWIDRVPRPATTNSQIRGVRLEPRDRGARCAAGIREGAVVPHAVELRPVPLVAFFVALPLALTPRSPGLREALARACRQP